MVIVGTSNAVNLTDGLDGLVSVPAIINLLCLILLIHACSNKDLAKQLDIPQILFSGELIFFCISLIGAILGFLLLNLIDKSVKVCPDHTHFNKILLFYNDSFKLNLKPVKNIVEMFHMGDIISRSSPTF